MSTISASSELATWDPNEGNGPYTVSIETSTGLRRHVPTYHLCIPMLCAVLIASITHDLMFLPPSSFLSHHQVISNSAWILANLSCSYPVSSRAYATSIMISRYFICFVVSLFPYLRSFVKPLSHCVVRSSVIEEGGISRGSRPRREDGE